MTATIQFKLTNRKTGEIIGRLERRFQVGVNNQYGLDAAIQDAKEWAASLGNYSELKLAKNGVFLD